MIFGLPEVTAATNPTDPTSLLRIQARFVAQNKAIALDWLSVTGRTYSVRFKTTLTCIWQTLTNNIAGTGAMLEVQASTSQNCWTRRAQQTRLLSPQQPSIWIAPLQCVSRANMPQQTPSEERQPPR